METNRIQAGNRVKVLINNEDATLLFSTEYTDVETVSQAIGRAFKDSGLYEDIGDFVFTVVNMTTGTEAQYRVTAGGHIKMID